MRARKREESRVTEISFRRARPEDADAVAALMYASSPGLVDFAFRMNDESPLPFLRRDFVRGPGLFGYENQFVGVDASGRVVATLTAYVGKRLDALSLQTMRTALAHFGVVRFMSVLLRSLRMAPLFIRPRRDGVFLANACVAEDARGKQIFTRLLASALADLAPARPAVVELDVSFANAPAQRTFEYLGFKTTGERPYTGKRALDGFRRMARAI
jgi:ribosomal protein S18 acetylase RimI-like enzyme